MLSTSVNSGSKPTPISINGESEPSTATDPRVGCSTPAISLSSVDFPLPFGPITPTFSPCSMRTSRPAMTVARLTLRARKRSAFINERLRS